MVSLSGDILSTAYMPTETYQAPIVNSQENSVHFSENALLCIQSYQKQIDLIKKNLQLSDNDSLLNYLNNNFQYTYINAHDSNSKMEANMVTQTGYRKRKMMPTESEAVAMNILAQQLIALTENPEMTSINKDVQNTNNETIYSVFPNDPTKSQEYTLIYRAEMGSRRNGLASDDGSDRSQVGHVLCIKPQNSQRSIQVEYQNDTRATTRVTYPLEMSSPDANL